jgi:hypothetical protein
MNAFDPKLIETARRVVKPEVGVDEMTLEFDNGVEIRYRRRVGDHWQVQITATVYVGDHFARLHDADVAPEIKTFWQAASEKWYRKRDESRDIALAGFRSIIMSPVAAGQTKRRSRNQS